MVNPEAGLREERGFLSLGAADIEAWTILPGVLRYVVGRPAAALASTH